jgi:2-keto-4-pentenoate hydratase
LAGKVVIGESSRNVTEVDLKIESVVSVNGDVEAAGVGADIMGHLVQAVTWLGNRLEYADEGPQAGELVMSGGIAAAIDIEPGYVFNVEFSNIGSIELRAE